jgi:hypothetical protein
MLCDAARDRLLTADDPARPAADLAAHLVECPACREFAAELRQLESAVRAYPTPASAIARRDTFLTNLSPAPRVLRARHIVAAFAALAAAVVIAVVTVALLRPEPSTDEPNQMVAQAGPAVVSDLVEWNLALTQTEQQVDRAKMVRERMPDMTGAIRRTAMSADDRALAEQLLANARKLGYADDPVDEAEIFHEISDTLLTRLDATADNPEQAETYARLYSQVVHRGVDHNLTRAEKQELRADKKARVQELRQAKKKQAAKADALVERIPPAAQEHVRPKAKPKGQKSVSK